MIIIWVFYLICILFLYFSKQYLGSSNIIALLAVLFLALLTSIYLFAFKNRYKNIFLGAFLVRFVFMIWDIYARHIYVLPNSGVDSEMFFQNAVILSRYPQLFTTMEGLRGGIYSQINGLLFYFVGPLRIIGHYINVLLGFSVVYIIYKILILLDIKQNTIKWMLILATFFPNSIIMSAIFLREVFPTFFVALSLYFFINWFINSKVTSFFLSIFLVFIASVFHSGVIGIILGYSFAYLFYMHKTKRLKFSFLKLTSFITVSGIFFIFFIYSGELILGKFLGALAVKDIYEIATPSGLGGSAYLKNVTIENPAQMVIFGPIKGIFFVSAPLPMNWRGFMDVFTFFTDSILYIFPLLIFIKNRKKIKHNKPLIISLFIAVVSCIMIFAVGVSNAGTAVRHRQKLVPIFIVSLAMLIDIKRNVIKVRDGKIKIDN